MWWLQARLEEIDRREHEEFEQDVTAGNPEAIPAKAALDAIALAFLPGQEDKQRLERITRRGTRGVRGRRARLDTAR